MLFDRAFGAIADVHRLMSFHDAHSDVSRLNRQAWRGPVSVDPHTLQVLRLASRISAASEGVFDVTLAPLLVASGFLPRPVGVPEPDPSATWRDIDVRLDGCVRFKKPLWLDLGGIAKGYGVDAAMRAADRPVGTSLSINAGGDLRIAGPQSAEVLLAVAGPSANPAPQLTLANRALASSQGFPARRRHAQVWKSPHRHGLTHRNLSLTRFVTVVAEHCAVADALTKVLLARGRAAAPLLRRFRAYALMHDGARSWRRVGVRT